MTKETLKEMLMRHEGYAQYPYQDGSCLTVGYGHNLTTRGISKRIAGLILEEDIVFYVERVEEVLPGYNSLTEARQWVVVSMAFNLGLLGFLRFKRMLAALSIGDWKEAAKEMRDSVWYIQVGKRAEELARMMEEG